jgi:hypothetical protein
MHLPDPNLHLAVDLGDLGPHRYTECREILPGVLLACFSLSWD